MGSIFAAGLLAAMLALPAFAEDHTPSPAASSAASSSSAAPDSATVISCGNGVPGGVMCNPTKEDIKEARSAFTQGVKLQRDNRLEEALDKYDQASRLDPRELKFLTARELVKAQLVFNHVERGNVLMTEDFTPMRRRSFAPHSTSIRTMHLPASGWKTRTAPTRRNGPRLCRILWRNQAKSTCSPSTL